MDGFVSCASCHRLIARSEETCPFCRARVRRCSAGLAAIVGTAIALAGCSGRTVDDPQESTTQVGTQESTAGSDAGSEATSSDTSSSSGPSTTEGSSSSSGSSTTDDSYTTAGFYAGGWDPDMGSGSGCGYECDIWNSDDCPDGEKCTAVSCEVGSSTWDTNVCRNIQGDAQPGDECEFTSGSKYSGEDTCAAGSMCWDLAGDTGFGVCVAFCQGDPDNTSCADGTSCVISNEGVLPVCLPSCDPLTQDCANPGESCYPTTDGPGYVCVYDSSGGMMPYGTPCAYLNVCNAGLACVEPEKVPEVQCDDSVYGCCSPMCSIAAGDSCPGAGQSCEPFFDPQPPGYEDVGVCSVAP